MIALDGSGHLSTTFSSENSTRLRTSVATGTQTKDVRIATTKA